MRLNVWCLVGWLNLTAQLSGNAVQAVHVPPRLLSAVDIRHCKTVLKVAKHGLSLSAVLQAG
jgi:hypothetical protein